MGTRGSKGICLVVAVAASALAATTGTPTAGARVADCRTAEVQLHDEAVFGHFATRSAAAALAHRAGALGFKGIKIENDGCGDYEVEIDGADSTSTRTSFANEAAKSGFHITFEQTAPPLKYHVRQMVGIIGRFTSIKRANALAWRLADVNFRYIDIAYYAAMWLVVIPQVPEKSVPSVTAELKKAGFHVLFQPGFE